MPALEAVFGKTVGAPEREQQSAAKIQSLTEQNNELITRLGQLSEENQAVESPAALREKIIRNMAARKEEEKAKAAFVSNFAPKTNEDLDKVQAFLTNAIGGSSIKNRELEVRKVIDAVNAAKRGDTSLLDQYKYPMQLYALNLYLAQKAGKK